MAPILQKHGSASSTMDSATGPLLAAVIEAKRATARALDAEHRRGTVDALVEHAHELGAAAIYGASEIGHSLAGAMVYASTRLRLWQPGEATPVLLVEGFVAALAGMQVAAQRAEAAGATRVDALVVGIVPDECEPRSGQRIRQLVMLGEAHREAA